MRHKYKGVSFTGGYDSNKSIARKLLRNFIESGSVTLTDKRARYVKQKIDRIVLRARRYENADKQWLRRLFGETAIINKLRSLDHIMKSTRRSGFVKTWKVGYRTGDASLMVHVEWTDKKPEKVEKKDNKTLTQKKNEKK